MPGFADIALGAAPIAGGALLGVAAGSIKAPDVRGIIQKDLDLLERLPADAIERRAELQRTIDGRVDGLIAAYEKNRSMRAAAMSYTGNWRDIVLFVCALLFTFIWWNIDHTTRDNWVLLLIVLILVSIITGIYATRGIGRAIRTFMQHGRDGGEAAK